MPKHSATSDHPAVELTELHKDFHTRGGVLSAVNDLSLTVPRGQTVALLGPNGAGKSTTIDMLLGMTTPTSGTVRIEGESPRAAIRRGGVGAMLQDGALIDGLTVREIVDMTACLYPNPRPVDEALELAGMSHLAKQRTTKLSGGESQRVRFAVAVVSNPSLLVLDEPTVAMDVQGREDFWGTMADLQGGGVTVLFASHYLDEADAHADRVVVVSKGRILADGTPQEIKALAGGRRIWARVDDPDDPRFAQLDGVSSASRLDDQVLLQCSDSDTAIRALLRHAPEATSIEIKPVGLEEAFVAITNADVEEVSA